MFKEKLTNLIIYEYQCRWNSITGQLTFDRFAHLCVQYGFRKFTPIDYDENHLSLNGDGESYDISCWYDGEVSVFFTHWSFDSNAMDWFKELLLSKFVDNTFDINLEKMNENDRDIKMRNICEHFHFK